MGGLRARINQSLDNYFKLRQNNSNLRREVIGGFTTFITMAYILIVNPAILEAAGIPKNASFVATVISAAFGTIFMGLYANRPFAIAPYMGENAFIAYTVCKVLGYPWEIALGAVFLGGVIFVFLTILRLRTWFARILPQSLKYSFSSALGLFLVFIGLNASGLIKLGIESAPVKVGNFLSGEAFIAFFCFILIVVLLIRGVNGAILIGLLSGVILSFFLGLEERPSYWVDFKFTLGPVFLKCFEVFKKPEYFLNAGFLMTVFTIFIMDFVDTLATLIGVSLRAGFLDNEGNLPQIERPMLCDALATVVGAIAGTTTSGTYIESASGIEEGARTGLSSCVVGILFILALFFGPILTVVPPYVYGAALIVVGALMLSGLKEIDFSDYTEFIPAFCVVTFTSFSYNLGVGITAGFSMYLILKLLTGRFKDLNLGTAILGILSILFFVFYPYG